MLQNLLFQVLRRLLDAGRRLPFPDALLINGQKDSAVFTGEKGINKFTSFGEMKFQSASIKIN